LEGIKKFKRNYKGKLALQIMFIDANKTFARKIAMLAKDIAADETQLNTPLRPCAVRPLTGKEMDVIKRYFKGMNVICVYDKKKKIVEPISRSCTLKRRGKERI
jgi:wyosine [tRNA(Phe)-imidazoG37] synthetase (radical SAM superfamily)